ncbi:MAG: hypothetical protein AABW86_02430 [Candidatus Micrarchaeota archaeon]
MSEKLVVSIGGFILFMAMLNVLPPGYTIEGGFQSLCTPSDILKCSSAKLSTNQVIIEGSVKNAIESINFDATSPQILIGTKSGDGVANQNDAGCWKKLATMEGSNLKMILDCPINLGALSPDNVVVLKWTVKTHQPYSENAKSEEEYGAIINKQSRPCTKIGKELVCNTELGTKIYVS